MPNSYKRNGGSALKMTRWRFTREEELELRDKKETALRTILDQMSVDTSQYSGKYSLSNPPSYAPFNVSHLSLAGIVAPGRSSPKSQFAHCDFAGAQLVEVDLRHAVFTHCVFTGTSFRYCDLYGAKFIECVVIGAKFVSCDMGLASFDDSDVAWSEVTNCNVDRLPKLAPFHLACNKDLVNYHPHDSRDIAGKFWHSCTCSQERQAHKTPKAIRQLVYRRRIA